MTQHLAHRREPDRAGRDRWKTGPLSDPQPIPAPERVWTDEEMGSIRLGYVRALWRRSGSCSWNRTACSRIAVGPDSESTRRHSPGLRADTSAMGEAREGAALTFAVKLVSTEPPLPSTAVTVTAAVPLDRAVTVRSAVGGGHRHGGHALV